jgi:RHS repeat-associated protein
VREAVDGRVVTWDHDDAGRPIACHLPGGTSVLYDRGPDGAPTGVRLETAGAGPVEVIRTWPAGLAPAEERWRGVLLRRERRDPAGRLTRLEESAAGTGPALLVTQVPDVRGLPATRRIELGGAGATETFSLDGQGRLARVAWEAPAEELVLVREPDGPLHSVRRRRAGAPDVTTGFLSRPSGPAVPAGTARADDADGLPMRLGDLDLEHDAHGRLVRVSSGGAEIAVIARDALGRVARLSWPGDAVDLIYDGRRPVLLRNAAGGETILVREPGGRLVEALTAAGPLRPLLDAEGSALGLADASGAPVATVGREPFGAARVVAGAWPPLLDSYHGMLPLPGTGLMLTPVRAYDPASGAFLSPDPAFPADGLDRYTYARGNPLGWVDPVGLMAVPAGATGRATSPGRAGGVALRRELSALDQAKLFYVGAAGAVLNLLLEPFLQVLDLTGGLVSAGFNLGGAEIDYRPMSGIGRMAAGGMGTGDILASMVTGIVETPGRVLDAIDRGDAHALGAESVNLVLLARGGAGVARGAGAFVFNRGVAAVGRLGSRGAQVQTRIRTWQVRRLERTAAATLPEEMGAANRPSVRYWANLEAYGRYQGNVRGTAPGAGSITIGEQAFTPSSIELLRAARTIFVEGGRRGYPQAAEIALHSLRGNLALRTVVHEMHHARQHWYRGQPSSGHGGDLLSQLLLETEFTQPGTSPTLSLIGAWNRELVVPPSPVWRGPTSLLGLLWAQPADGG